MIDIQIIGVEEKKNFEGKIKVYVRKFYISIKYGFNKVDGQTK